MDCDSTNIAIQNFRRELQLGIDKRVSALADAEAAVETARTRLAEAEAMLARFDGLFVAEEDEPDAMPPDPKRPNLLDACIEVLKGKQLSAGQVVDELRARRWLPSSNNPASYVAQTLSKHPNFFRKISRGIYTTNLAVVPEAPKSPDQALADVGIAPGNVQTNPFSR